MKYQTAALAVLLNASTILAGVQRRDGSDRRWGQCAGQNYNGPTDCPSGWTCQLQNPYYSQCLQGSDSGSGSGSVSGGSNSTGSTSTGSTGSGTGSKAGLGVSPVSSSSTLPSGVTSFGTVGGDDDDDDDDGEDTCDTEGEEDEKTASAGTTPAVGAPAGKVAAGVVTNPSGTAGGGGSGTTGSGTTGSGTTGSGTTGSSTTGSGTTGSGTTGSGTTGSGTTGSGTTDTNPTESTGSGTAQPATNNKSKANIGGGGSALATTTQYGPISGSGPGACGCAGSWQNGDTTSGNDTMVTTAAGGPSILDGYCGAGCGACYLLTSTGKPPCSDDACKVSAGSAGQTLTVMVTNGCPTQGNEQWCSVPNKFGYEAHFDLAVQPPGWGNVVVSYEPTSCPGSLTGNWAGCKCAGQRSPHEGAVPSGGKTSVS